MTDLRKLITLSPDDDSETFYKKLLHLSQDQIAKQIQRFEKYAKYYNVLKFHQAALQRSDLNVGIKYNYRYGWHISSCIRSLPDAPKPFVDNEICQCDTHIANPDKYFELLRIESMSRCKICKHPTPDFVTWDKWDKSGGNDSGDEDGDEGNGGEGDECTDDNCNDEPEK